MLMWPAKTWSSNKKRGIAPFLFWIAASDPAIVIASAIGPHANLVAWVISEAIQ